MWNPCRVVLVIASDCPRQGADYMPGVGSRPAGYSVHPPLISPAFGHNAVTNSNHFAMNFKTRLQRLSACILDKILDGSLEVNCVNDFNKLPEFSFPPRDWERL